MRKIRLGGQQVILFGESGADNPCGWRGNSVLAESMVGRDGPRKRCSTGQLDVLCGQYNQTCCACDAKEMRAEFGRPSYSSPRSSGTSTACSFNALNGTTSSVRSWVEASTTGAALPSW